MTDSPLVKISDALTDETDYTVEGVDVCVTRGAGVGGNEVTLNVHGDGGIVLGFESKADFEEFVDRLIVGGDLEYVEVDQ